MFLIYSPRRTCQIFAAIGDCATGQTLEFSDKHYTSAYVENMDTIMDIKNDAPNEYHALMHRLYRQAWCVSWLLQLSGFSRH